MKQRDVRPLIETGSTLISGKPMKLWLAIPISFSIVLVASPSSAQQLTLDDARIAVASVSSPQVRQSEAHLTLWLDRATDLTTIGGRCIAGRPVIVTGRAFAAPIAVRCDEGRYQVRSIGIAPRVATVVATQLMPDEILVARWPQPPATPSGDRIAVKPNGIARMLPAERARTIVIEPGRYEDVSLELTGSSTEALTLDGEGMVTFSGRTRVDVRRSNVTLRGLRFENTGAETIVISAPQFRLTDSEFENCGDQKSTFGHCIIARSGAQDLEVDFNRFTRSPSMTIKIRAGLDGDEFQPTGAYVHHNLFASINRRASNGQEPIQIAGPNGGGTGISMKARIEHNVFFRSNGDREAISLKASENFVRWNLFKDMDAAPTIRGGSRNTVSDNLLIHTRPIRVSGPDHVVSGNMILCPSAGPGILLSNGSQGYGAATDTFVVGNIIVAKRAGIAFISQEPEIRTRAENNMIIDNAFILYGRDRTSGIGTSKNDDFDYLSMNTVRENSFQVDALWLRHCMQ